MSTDSFRIEASLIARNQAGAAANRAPEAGFSNLLEQAARSLSQDERPSEANTGPACDRAESPDSRERTAQPRPPGEQARTPEARRASEGRDDSENNDDETRTAEPDRASTAQDKTAPVQDRKAAELKRLLKQIQDSKSGTRMPGTSSAQNDATVEGLEDQPSDAPGSPKAHAGPADPDATGALAETRSLPTGEATQSARPADLTVQAGSTQTPTAAQHAIRRFDRPAGDRAQADTSGLQGLIAGNGRPDLPQAALSPAQAGSLPAHADSRQRSASPAHAHGSDFAATLAVSLQRSTEIMPGAELTHALLTQTTGPDRAALADITASSATAANQLGGSLAAVLNPAAGPSPSSAAGLQSAAVQWTLPYTPADARFGEALGERLNWMIRDGLQQAEITLNPRELGPIRIALSMEGDAAQLGIQADHAFTRQTIEDALPRLKALLAEQGVQLGQTQIDQGSGRDQGSSDHQAGGHRRAQNGEQPAAAELGSLAARDGMVRAGQVGLRSPGAGRVDVFA